MAGQRNVALLGQNEAGVGDSAAGAADSEQRNDLVAAGGGVLVGVGAVAFAQDEGITRRKLGLPLRRGDGAGVVDLGAHQQHEATAGGDRRRRVGGDQRTLLDHDLAAGTREARQVATAALGRIDAAALELSIGDIGAGRDQRADIDLACAAEDDAVLVDDEHPPGGIDPTENLARAEIADNAVERGPGASLLVEIHRGLAADVEGLPVQDRLRRSLVDGDGGLAAAGRLGRQIRSRPQTGTRRRARRDLKAARPEAIRHGHLRQRGRALRRCGGTAGGCLRRLQRLDRLRCTCERALALPCDLGGLLSSGGCGITGDGRRRSRRGNAAEGPCRGTADAGQHQRQHAGSGKPCRAAPSPRPRRNQAR